jgi:DNA-binding transcriptional LysR family regulator
VRLFDRTPRGVELTAAGRAFVTNAQQLPARATQLVATVGEG